MKIFLILHRPTESCFRRKFHLVHEKSVHLMTVRFINVYFIEIFYKSLTVNLSVPEATVRP